MGLLQHLNAPLRLPSRCDSKILERRLSPGESREKELNAMVLELDLYHLTLQQIGEFVRSKCSQYGTVLSVSVKLFPISSDHGRSFAVIEMASPEENTKLRDTIGDGYAERAGW